jgi:hypothetical protein
MKRAHVLLVVVGVAIAASAAGYWVGLRQGDKSGVFIMAMRAPTSLMYLQAIQDGNIDQYAILMEYDIDETLLANHYLEEQPMFRILPPFWGADAEASRRESLTRLADYRKAHPSPQRPEALDALLAQVSAAQRNNVPEFTPELRQSMLKQQEIIAEMVSRYATNSSKAR